MTSSSSSIASRNFSNDLHGIPSNPPSYARLAEETIFLRVLTSIPVLGMIPCMTVDLSLRKKCLETNEVPRKIYLLELTNCHRMGQIAGNLVAAAILVSVIALGILILEEALAVAALAALLTQFAGFLYFMNQNDNEIINRLRAQQMH